MVYQRNKEAAEKKKRLKFVPICFFCCFIMTKYKEKKEKLCYEITRRMNNDLSLLEKCFLVLIEKNNNELFKFSFMNLEVGKRRSDEQIDNFYQAYTMDNIRSEVFLYLSNNFNAHHLPKMFCLLLYMCTAFIHWFLNEQLPVYVCIV
jgi:hypothetical protein